MLYPRHVKNESEYKAAVKLIRHFAKGFKGGDGYDLRKPFKELSRYQRRKLNRYSTIVQELMARPHKIIRPRRKDHLRALQEFSRQQDFPRDLTAVFMPVADPTKPLKITYDKKQKRVIKVREAGVINRTEIPFDPVALALTPKIEIKRITDTYPAQRYILLSNEFEIPGSVSINYEMLLRKATRLMEKYHDEKVHGYFGNWLKGVVLYDFPDSVAAFRDWEAFNKQKIKIRKMLKEARSYRTSKKRRAYLLKKLKAYNLEMYALK